MKKTKLTFALLLTLTATMGFASCSDDDPTPETETPTTETTTPDDGNDNETGGETTISNTLNITVGNETFACTLADNETATDFKAKLPLTVTMSELNGNEKYYYLSDNLPTNSYRQGTIEIGDLMLYGSNCIVLFYETFSSSYSYTRIGKIDNPDGLAAALGAGDVSVTFELNNSK